jgi:hypothetical protein
MDKNNQGKRQRKKSSSPYQPQVEDQLSQQQEPLMNNSSAVTNQTKMTTESSRPLQSVNTSFLEPQPVPLGTLMSRNLFDSIYSWIDDQVYIPSPLSTSPTTASSPSNNFPPSPLHRVPSSDASYSISSHQSPFVAKSRRRAYSTPATVAPASLPPIISLASSLSESVSTSDLFGSLVLADDHYGASVPIVNHLHSHCRGDRTPLSLECVTNIFEKGIKQYQQATELSDPSQGCADFL